MWPSKVRTILSVSNVALWIGLLVDFEGAATRVGSMLPVIDALMPILALGFTVGGVTWLLFEAVTWHPSYRRGQRLKQHTALLEEINSTSATDIRPDDSALWHALNRCLEAKVILEEQFKIPCPHLKLPETTDNEDENKALRRWVNSWSIFTAVLLPRVRAGDLTNARHAIDDIDKRLQPMARWGKSGKTIVERRASQ